MIKGVTGVSHWVTHGVSHFWKKNLHCVHGFSIIFKAVKSWEIRIMKADTENQGWAQQLSHIDDKRILISVNI